jgi:hypothetical protein
VPQYPRTFLGGESTVFFSAFFSHQKLGHLKSGEENTQIFVNKEFSFFIPRIKLSFLWSHIYFC